MIRWRSRPKASKPGYLRLCRAHRDAAGQPGDPRGLQGCPDLLMGDAGGGVAEVLKDRELCVLGLDDVAQEVLEVLQGWRRGRPDR